jgi:outer membrane receptor protein involved in Fe transport
MRSPWSRTGVAVIIALLATAAWPSIFGSVHGLIHDPQHRPVAGAQVFIRAANSNWSKTVETNSSGEFVLDSLPLGEYSVSVDVPGFEPEQQKLMLTSGHDAQIHFSLQLAQAKETVEVMDEPVTVNTQSSTSSSIVSREDISESPGADQTNSLAMIANYTPSAVMVHDQLHIRGGHQVSWLLDGVPVPNTNIASNVGPQFDPKDIDYLEVQRGGYNAEYGDRTYGVFNVVTRSGFERNRQGELVASYGSYNNTNNQISLGDHTDRFAWYGSLSGYRTDFGLETPDRRNLHNQAAGLGGFGSLIFNKTPNDQLRLVTSLRGDHYQVPNFPEQQDAGIRDVENERDAFANFSWLHTFTPGMVLTVSPFYHFNRAHYLGNYEGVPDQELRVPTDDRGSNYFGGVVSMGITGRRHTFRAGVQAFGHRDNQLFAVDSGDGAQIVPPARQIAWGNVTALFLEDQFKLTPWLTLNGGMRFTHFQGDGFQTDPPSRPTVAENAADPRIGAALRIPKLNWVARAFYGRYYQAPPLLTIAGPLLDQCGEDGSEPCVFASLRGERNEQREFGLAIPLKGWTVDISNFRTTARNYFDHDALGNSNIFFPLTLERARIRGWEVTATSPRIAHLASWHLAYSHQYAQWSGSIAGGLVGDESCEPAPGAGPLCFLDHDQRNTLSTGFNMTLPWRVWSAFNIGWGSGFLDGDGPGHLPAHTTYDISIGKSFGENWQVKLSALNLADNRYLIDQTNTFGGTHYANPREVSVQLKYRFRF